MKRYIFVCVLVVIFALLLVPAASFADIIISGNQEGGSGDVENVLCGVYFPGHGEPTTVFGSLNQSGHVVKFKSNVDIIAPANEKARIAALDVPLNSLLITMEDPNLGFDKIQFNIDAEKDGNVEFSFNQGEFTGPFAINRNGQNWFTAIASSDNELIREVSILSDVGILDLKQIRLRPNCQTAPDGDSTVAPVPEPATMLLLGVGLVGLAGFRRKFKH